MTAPLAASAAGMGIPDLGAASVAQGAATVARPQDIMSFYYNPAGLASQPGLRVQLDTRGVNHATRFQRVGEDGSAAAFDPVMNEGGPSIVPMGGVSWQLSLGERPLTLAVGGHSFNGYTGYKYPDPVELRALVCDPPAAGSTMPVCSAAQNEEVSRYSPQRYTTIRGDSKIYLPVVAAAVRVFDWMDVGLALQAPLAFFSSRQAIYANVVPGESSGYDAVFTLEADDTLTVSGVVGASFALPKGLFLGVAFQKPTSFHAPGTVTVELPPFAEALGARVHGNEATLHIDFPAVVRGGLRLVREAFEVELAGVWEGWERQKKLTLDARKIEVELLGSKSSLGVIEIEKELMNAGSARLGGTWKPGALWPTLSWLTVRAGGLREWSAVRSARQSLDMMHWDRWAVSGGIGTAWDRFAVDLAYLRYIQPTRTIRASKVQQVTAIPTVAKSVVGNGDYDSQIDIVAVAVTAKFP